ncbi:unnamed protein product, partial [Discosporangium mesarthrocarpum]
QGQDQESQQPLRSPGEDSVQEEDSEGQQAGEEGRDSANGEVPAPGAGTRRSGLTTFLKLLGSGSSSSLAQGQRKGGKDKGTGQAPVKPLATNTRRS